MWRFIRKCFGRPAPERWNGYLPEELAQVILAGAMGRNTPFTPTWASRGIFENPHPAALDSLLRAIEVSNNTGFQSARIALHSIVEKFPECRAAVAAELIRILATTQGRDTKLSAIMALRDVDTDQTAAIPVLENCLRDPDEMVREYAKNRLEVIRPAAG